MEQQCYLKSYNRIGKWNSDWYEYRHNEYYLHDVNRLFCDQSNECSSSERGSWRGVTYQDIGSEHISKPNNWYILDSDKY